MKTLLNYNDIPSSAVYLGSELGDGSMMEEINDSINEAIDPICFKDDDGVKHYFDLVY
jgi:hypothetical protein